MMLKTGVGHKQREASRLATRTRGHLNAVLADDNLRMAFYGGWGCIEAIVNHGRRSSPMFWGRSAADALSRRGREGYSSPVRCWCCCACSGLAHSARADDNVMLNGDLSQGFGQSTPSIGRPTRGRTSLTYTTYNWNHNPGSAGELEISSVEAQRRALGADRFISSPGWYHFTAEIRAEGVGQDPNLGGACLSVLEDGIVSQQLRGTNNWQTVGLYLKVGDVKRRRTGRMPAGRLRVAQHRQGLLP